MEIGKFGGREGIEEMGVEDDFYKKEEPFSQIKLHKMKIEKMEQNRNRRNGVEESFYRKEEPKLQT